MSTTTTTETTDSPVFVHTPESLNYAVTHIFFPTYIPRKDDDTLENNFSLARAVCAAAHTYSAHVHGSSEAQWNRITRMLHNLQASVQSEHLDRDQVISQLRGMQSGDILVFFLRPENFAMILTERENYTLLESFEVFPDSRAVDETAGSLICSYPGFTVRIPNKMFVDEGFQFELANSLCCPCAIDSEHYTPFHVRYITALLSGILQGLNRATDVPRIVKRVRVDREGSWRRSSLWLVVRVAIQMALDCSPGRASYKEFMLSFICGIARDANITTLSRDRLHLMAFKILRRLRKIGSSVPNWLSQTALETCAGLREILDGRWRLLNTRSSSFRNPSQDELRRDTELSLEHSRQYICDTLANYGREPVESAFRPSHHRRGTIDDFLSDNGTFFDRAYDADPMVTLYDVKQLVQHGIDDWIASVTNVEEACAHLEILMDKYMIKADECYPATPEHLSISLLTGIELFVALDKLIVNEFPMLIDYSPEIPIVFLERLFLRSTASLHRLSLAYQYLSGRHSQSRPGWSVLSDEFTEDSFAVCYYAQSPRLQQLKARIEEDAMVNCDGHRNPHHQPTAAENPQSPLPALSLHAQVVVFELQCPACIRIWRSSAARILHYFYYEPFCSYGSIEASSLLSNVPALQRYIANHDGPSLEVQIHLAYLYPAGPQTQNSPSLLHACQSQCTSGGDKIENWRQKSLHSQHHDFSFLLPSGHSLFLREYIESTSHMSNNVLATQAECPMDLSLDEFIAFAHLRSGGSLQWANILQGLRSRTLNLRDCGSHFLLTTSVSQVGPLDLNTGTWIWHQDLQEPSFCDALLSELESLSMDIRAGSIDGTMMNTISLLVTRVLASSPGEAVSKRAISLLGSVRRKTFNWVQELSYNLAVAPTNKERSRLLLYMAVTCRSTFDVDSATLPKLFQSAEDVDAALSCALLVFALDPKDTDDEYLQLLLERNYHLSLALERVLWDIILADPSDYGIDLAVRKIFPSHKAGTGRWEQLQQPNGRWLTCRTKVNVDQPSKMVHLNLLNWELRVDGRPSGGLPCAIRDDPEYQQIFREQGFFLTQSNLPGMDFTTLTAMCKHKVHFSLRGDNLVIRAKSNESKDILELIHSSKLQGDLPPSLVDGHVHWLNLSTRMVEIRPVEMPWEQSPNNWIVDCTSGKYRAYKGRETLVDMRSPTWATVSKCFEDLNVIQSEYSDKDSKYIYKIRSNNLLITTSSPVHSSESAPVLKLSAALLCYGLSFFVNERGELESRDFKGMVYDENQCVGALYGLEHLVLRSNAVLPAELIPRRVLIPNGVPRLYGSHDVCIDAGKDNTYIGPGEPLYRTYTVDTELGCLVGSRSLKSMKYLVVLHALTSCDKPDPLTGKTGVQAAYFLLQSAGCRSIMKLKALNSGPSECIHEGFSKQYPLIGTLYEEIKNRYYWGYPHSRTPGPSQVRAMQRAAYLLPWHGASGPTPLKDRYYDASNYLTTPTPTESDLSTCPSPDFCKRYTSNEEKTEPIRLDWLLSNRGAPELPPRNILLRDSSKISSEDIPKLDRLFTSLATNKPDFIFQREYVALLEKSVQCVHESRRTIYRLMGKDRTDTLTEHYLKCRVNFLTAVDILKESLGPTTDPYQQALSQFGQWPPIAVDVLLQCLASASPIDIPGQWKKCLVSLALLLLDLQRARRLLSFALEGLEEEFSKELDNEVCDGWEPEEYPDWLLIQIQGNFLIRRSQAEIAIEMINPESGRNTVMQVNMGEGKSSVIIPIVAAALADGKQLVRVIVPKALTTQMFELLVARLGGLANRPIYHLPFSRSPEYRHDTSLQINVLHKLILQCKTERGILLVQPEHIVSLKLKSVEEHICIGKHMADPFSKLQKSLCERVSTSLLPKLLPEDSFVGGMFRWLSQSANFSSQKDVARAVHHDELDMDVDGASDSASKWLNLQKWMDSHARDILDESDEILHPRFQLIYTIGLEQHMDGYPDRWTITQQVLRLIRECAPTLSRDHPNSIEYQYGPRGSFPYIRCVRTSNVGQCLVSLIMEDVMAGRLPSLNFKGIGQELRDAIRSFISDQDILQLPDTVKRVKEYADRSDQSGMWSGLLVLRGLLACKILLFALTERRWSVDYGLLFQESKHCDRSPVRTMLAVPYVAKDMPAPNTQFGHPDITIILTCLSYYYSGLSEEQLRSSFEILLDHDDPSTEYTLWIQDYNDDSLPDSLRTLGEINLRSSEQWDKSIFPLFSRNQRTIDFYLSRVVFPREAKEFPWKISASSWDLAEERNKVITGFSGTNDARWLLPMSITQKDLYHQQGTNAKVLGYLLLPENGFYMPTHQNGKRETTPKFLRTVVMQKPEIRVLLDVGAQILDFSNIEVAKAWLSIDGDAAGAVYFDENDEMMILNQHGTSMPMTSSPLSQQLGRCVVYLDHAHTRGTDIKLPVGSRAAVTLGPKVTKDRLVQGCMRMRKLGHGHSVMFFAPPEVDLSIRALTGKQDSNTPVTTVDILCWTIHETWNDIYQRAASWAQQGMNHKSRHGAWLRFCNDDITPKQLSDAWLQAELKSLEDLYVSCETKNSPGTLLALDPAIHPRCKDLGVLSLPSAQMEEEQEREVNRQKEREREVELPPRAKPEKHFLHPDVVTLVNTGVIPSLHSCSAFRPIFTTLNKSSAATHEANVWSPFILATTDFCNTIKPESTQGTIDQYLRPVQWVLSCKRNSDEMLVLLSPFEANLLLPLIRESEHVHLHVYAPRTSQCVKPSDDLRLYAVPPLPSDWTPPWALIDQLNVFAGQLYLRDYQSYLRLGQFLGIPVTELPKDGATRRNIIDIPGSWETNEVTFSDSPLPAVKALLAIRTRGQPFAHTHMGKILQGLPLREKDFQAPRPVASSDTDGACDRNIAISSASGNIPSPMDVEPELWSTVGESKAALASLPHTKRRLEMTEIPNAGLELPNQKRLRLD